MKMSRRVRAGVAAITLACLVCPAPSSSGDDTAQGKSNRPALTSLCDALCEACREFDAGAFEIVCGRAKPDAKLLQIVADITGDGQDDLLVSREDCRNGRSGTFWLAYIQGDSGFTRVPIPVTMNPRFIHLVKTGEGAERALVSLTPAGGGKCRLVTLRLKDGEFRATVLARMELGKADPDASEIWEQLWGADSKCVPVATLFSEAVARCPQCDALASRSGEEADTRGPLAP